MQDTIGAEISHINTETNVTEISYIGTHYSDQDTTHNFSAQNNTDNTSTETQHTRAESRSTEIYTLDHPSQSHFPTPIIPRASSTPNRPCAHSNSPPTTADSSTSPMIKNMSTFNHSLSLSLDQPLSKEEERLNTHLIKRKLHTDPHRKTVKCKTKG
ncbi:hypothetical protein PoB_005796700 [Plakobranchus ocellatus]|uniref:Uncharacterized protein n=1 Tax=Plakobranchus ocellatus TaxID=259542 RepID=A0AAV4CJ00_9GAST|nr:hypothetical protein PoB_005796700 [Plakobranchus ocellatus]